jgi:hypothetical protein
VNTNSSSSYSSTIWIDNVIAIIWTCRLSTMHNELKLKAATTTAAVVHCCWRGEKNHKLQSYTICSSAYIFSFFLTFNVPSVTSLINLLISSPSFPPYRFPFILSTIYISYSHLKLQWCSRMNNVHWCSFNVTGNDSRRTSPQEQNHN